MEVWNIGKVKSILTYSPKYAHYQKTLRDKQVECAHKMLDCGNAKKNHEELLDTLKTRNLPKFRSKDLSRYINENLLQMIFKKLVVFKPIIDL